MIKSFLLAAIVIAMLTHGVKGQNGDFDNLRLDGGSGSPTLTFAAGSANNENIRITGFSSGLGFYPPGVSTPPIWIGSDALPNTLKVHQGGVGIGTHPSFGASAPLHLYGDGTADLFTPFEHPWMLIQDASSTAAHRIMLSLVNNGGASLRYENTATNDSWQTSVLINGDFRISRDGSGGHEFRIARSGRLFIGPGNQTVFDLQENGNLRISGALTQSSDRNKKESIVEVDNNEVLNKLLQIPVHTWKYKTDEDNIRHMGPMAQDFYAQFALGEGATTISSIDTAGVTIAAIKALNQKLKDELANKTEQINLLEAKLNELEARFEVLESTTR